ncbi:LysR family transcriptional regulator [Bradyrhizobium sp. dw_411]|uniref:LysR substrate-binding domain-containing protein n=1 Tax=Bradyrhizobium sp. dw_411 TaxID=2720082 RepID=UPI001BD16305|nr:LysR family transcriptional regulator [Bradyrhizobium sp. dw_411]
MIRHVELHVLIQTLIAAEQGSFHKAGTLLGIPASTVSRRVRSLETQLGVKLFERHRHGIRPTAASNAFFKPIRRILDELNTVLINAKTIARGKTGALNIGLYVSPSSGHLRMAIREYKQAFPSVDVQYVEGERGQLMERLNAGSIDVAIVAGHFRSGMHDVVPLWSEKILVAMAATHPLANKATLKWDDLRNEHILLGRDPGPELRDHLLSRLNASGDLPAIRHSHIGRDFVLSLLDIESDITLLYEADTGAQHPGVIYREVADNEGPSLVPYFACWITSNDNPALQHFLDLLRQHKGPQRQPRHRRAG